MLYKFKLNPDLKYAYVYSRENTTEYKFVLRQEAVKIETENNYSLLLLEEKNEHNGRKLKNPLLRVLYTCPGQISREMYVEIKDVEPLFNA